MQRDTAPTGNGDDSVARENRGHQQAACLFTGVGSGQPTPRTKTMGMFGYIPDAFTSKSLEFNGDSVSRHRPAGAPANTAAASQPSNEHKTPISDDVTDGCEQNGEVGEDTEATVDGPMNIFSAVSILVMIARTPHYVV